MSHQPAFPTPTSTVTDGARPPGRRSSWAVRLLRAVLLAVGLTTAVLTATAGAASASVGVVTDGFEGSQAYNWRFTHVGDGAGGLSSLQNRRSRRTPAPVVMDDQRVDLQPADPQAPDHGPVHDQTADGDRTNRHGTAGHRADRERTEAGRAGGTPAPDRRMTGHPRHHPILRRGAARRSRSAD